MKSESIESFETSTPIIDTPRGGHKIETPNDPQRTLPASEEGEQHIIGCVLMEGDSGVPGDTLGAAINAGIRPHSFYWPNNQNIWGKILEMRDSGKTVSTATVTEELLRGGDLGVIGGMSYLMLLASKVSTTAHAPYFINVVKEKADRRQFIRDLTGAVEQGYNGSELPELLQTAKARIEAIQTSSTAVKAADSLKTLQSRRVSITAKPSEPVTRLFLANKPVCTPGNITTLISRAKTGKTATLGGAVAAIIAATVGKTDVDALGFTSANPEGKAVIHIDTEQSIYDAWTCYERAVQRAGVNGDIDPKWLYHYALVGYPVQQLKESLVLACEQAEKTHNGLHIIILDGVADLVLSVNDEAESKSMVTFLRSLAVKYDCPIIAVIHSNEAIKAGDDGRGHLGKELTRKAESNLLLKKCGEITVITSEKQRKAPITEEDGIAFKWSDQEGRHVSCGTPRDAINDEKRSNLRDLATEIFSEKTVLKWREILEAIMSARNVSKNTADRRIQEMRNLGVIKTQFSGSYCISDS